MSHALPFVISAGKVVGIEFTLTNPEGELLDRSEPGAPLLYLHGMGQIVPGLEQALEGRKKGERLQIVVKPDEGYGELSGEEPQSIPRDSFPPEAELEPDQPVMATTPDGETIVLFIVDLDDDQVWVSLDHPLAGQTLHFDVHIISMRDATPEEQEHGHPHGPDGHAGHHH
ncbi:MAG: peptidylprolyl isomerase [Planctomycetes bacterium]|nr:peptidylprolyl isomerase [Planctomycetota bacterium]